MYPEISLSKMSLLSLAKAVWEFHDVRMIRKDFYNDINTMANWHKKVTNSVLFKFDSLLCTLPKKLKTKLEKMIIYTGEEIYTWTEYLICSGYFTYSLNNEIYFTPFGTIDESRTFSRFYDKEEKLNNVYIACCLGQQELIFEIRNGIMEHIAEMLFEYLPALEAARNITDFETRMNQYEKKDDLVFALLSTWINIYCEKRYFVFDKNFKTNKILNLGTRSYDTELINIEQRVIPVCLKNGFIEPAKYFLRRQPKYSSELYSSLLNEYVTVSSGYTDPTDYIKRKYVEFIFFILNKIEKEREIVLSSEQYKHLLKWTLKHWQFQDLFFDIFNSSLDLGFISEYDYKQFLYLAAMKGSDTSLKVQKNSYRLIFKELFEGASKEIKTNNNFYHLVFKIFLDSFDYASVKYLMGFIEDVKEGKYCFFKEFSLLLRRCLKTENKRFSTETKNFEELFDSAEAVKNNLRNYLIRDLLSEGDFAGLDKLFSWRPIWKKDEMDGIYSVDRLVRCGKSHLADDFLKWLYVSEEKRSEVKNHFRSEKFSKWYHFWIYSQPARPVHEMKDHCTKFLNFIYDSEEEIQTFKRKVLFKDEFSVLEFALSFDEDYYEGTESNDYFPIEDLIDFCELTEEDIQGLKQKCLDNFEELASLFISKCRCFIVFDDVIKWLLDDEDERQKLIQKIMKLPCGILICSKMLLLTKKWFENEEIMLRFYNRWAISCENFPEIKKKLLDMNRGELTETDERKISTMFEKLEKGEKLVFDEIICFSEKDGSFSEGSDIHGCCGCYYKMDKIETEEINTPDGFVRFIFDLIEYNK